MERIDEMNGLAAASQLLDEKSRELCSGPLPIWVMVAHAKTHVNNRLEAMLRGEE